MTERNVDSAQRRLLDRVGPTFWKIKKKKNRKHTVSLCRMRGVWIPQVFFFYECCGVFFILHLTVSVDTQKDAQAMKQTYPFTTFFVSSTIHHKRCPSGMSFQKKGRDKNLKKGIRKRGNNELRKTTQPTHDIRKRGDNEEDGNWGKNIRQKKNPKSVILRH